MNQGPLLGVNVDHIATIRQARRTRYPQPVYAAMEAEQGGADGITIHLREDLRHIQKDDVRLIKESILTHLNLEMALTSAMLDFACAIQPQFVCLVPEKRRELTTEGGLDVITHHKSITAAQKTLAAAQIRLSVFIDPDQEQISAVKDTGAPFVELHSGAYADAALPDLSMELNRIIKAAEYAHKLGLEVNAGHGLNYQNVKAISNIPHLYELNIGHSIVARALFVGMRTAVREMKNIMEQRPRPATMVG